MTATAREALVAELLGDAARLLDRIDAVMPRLEAQAQNLERVAARLPQATKASIEVFAAQAVEIGTAAANGAVVTVNRSSKAIFHAQTQELKTTAREIFTNEVSPPLRQLTERLHAAIRQSQENPWDRWLTYVATAAVAMVLPMVMSFLISLASPAKATAMTTPTVLVPECGQPALAPAVSAGLAPQTSKAHARR